MSGFPAIGFANVIILVVAAKSLHYQGLLYPLKFASKLWDE